MQEFKVMNTRDLGPQFTKNNHKMVGQDGAYSIPLNGETLWFFGDTLIGTRDPSLSLWYLDGRAVGAADMSGKGTIEHMINNTGLILGNKTGENGLSDFHYILDEQGGLKNLIPLHEDEDHDEIRIWCQHGICLGDSVYLSFIKVRMLEEPNGVLPVAFEILGSGFAKGSKKDWNFQRILYQGSDLWWDAKQPRFASAMYQEDDWIYCCGVIQDDKQTQNCYMARVKADQIENRTQYTYLSSTKPEWDANLDKAIPIFTGMPNELSLSYNNYLERYLAVHSVGLTGITVGLTAPHPWGPWSEAVDLWKVSTKHNNPRPYPKMIYAGKEHVELAKDNGRTIYMTYIEFEEYFPHLIEITLDRIIQT
jgi:hypothetical protein